MRSFRSLCKSVAVAAAFLSVTASAQEGTPTIDITRLRLDSNGTFETRATLVRGSQAVNRCSLRLYVAGAGLNGSQRAGISTFSVAKRAAKISKAIARKKTIKATFRSRLARFTGSDLAVNVAVGLICKGTLVTVSTTQAVEYCDVPNGRPTLTDDAAALTRIRSTVTASAN